MEKLAAMEIEYAIIVDAETTIQKIGHRIDGSPHNPQNKCVCVSYVVVPIGTAWEVTTKDITTDVYYHKDQYKTDDPAEFQFALDRARVFVAHNAKFDYNWFTQMGFKLPDQVHCTMLGEFIYARGQIKPLSLKETAIRRAVALKKSDLVEDLFKSGVGYEAMPLKTVIEYCEADVISCYEIYKQQIDDLKLPENNSLTAIFDLMNEMLLFLVEVETNGIKIDLEKLNKVEEDYSNEKKELEDRLQQISISVMGDTPINLSSGQDMTKLVYSREVTNRDLHKQLFNIGIGANGKPLHQPRMKPSRFKDVVRQTTRVIQKTVVQKCVICNGSGRQYKLTKSGVPFKKQPRCGTCVGEGVIYKPTGQTAGLRLLPRDAQDVSINGFKVDKVTIQSLIKQAEQKNRPVAVEFLTKVSRLNAVNTYLNSFVNGIKVWTRNNNILHPNFNQTVARTGRLSSSNPNFQNQPKSKDFPIRAAVVSRFENGLICEADFSGLELMVAGEISRDSQIISDIQEGKDLHKQTASIIHQIPPDQVSKDLRSQSKKWSFNPLFGGLGYGEAEHIQNYFKQFFVIYKGLKKYHEELCIGVLDNGIVQTPSGRQYYFPNAKRTRNGRITNYTQVVNYPIQGFGSELTVLACIRSLERFKRAGLASKLILTVHDSIVVDVAPDELESVKNILKDAMENVPDEVKKRFCYDMLLPVTIEVEAGKNWMEMEEV